MRINYKRQEGYIRGERMKPEDRFLFCKNMNESLFCKVKKHSITNGLASKCHCGGCKYFESNQTPKESERKWIKKIK